MRSPSISSEKANSRVGMSQISANALRTIVVRAASLPGLAHAGTWTDDFADDVLTPPGTDIEGNNSEAGGQLHAAGIAHALHSRHQVSTRFGGL